jgi:UDP-3-O-[3-hydroxymyristoyl] glucosamine N-acyltransferase
MEISLSEVLVKLPVAEVVGNKLASIKRVVQLSSPDKQRTDIFWVSDKNVDQLSSVGQGIIICSKQTDPSLFNNNCTYLLVETPRLYFLKLVNTFFMEREDPVISKRASIHGTAKVGENCSIGDGVVIEKNCIIGDGVEIGPNTVLKAGTHIGNRVKIGANNTIGGVGFGYERNEEGQYDLIPHIGNVVLEDGVEIGNNTTIDRAVLGSTIVKRNAKVDNLVHIAHGVVIGENSLVIANAMVAGSAIIGDNVWVAPSSSILNKIQVGNDVVIGMGAVVLKSVPDGQVMVGNPAKELKR